ncbi:MAG: glycosyltransferase [Desulfomonilaceae bacterium]
MNRKNLTISIITASLNSAATIRDCVQSIRKQTYPVEHIIVDGLSTDETLAAAEKYSRPDAVIISERDQNLYEAINKGIATSKGDVIGTLNSDDFYPHNRIISIVHRVFKNPDIDACYGDLVYVDRKDTSRIVRYWRSSPYSDKLINRGWMPPHPTFFVRRSVYEKHGPYRLDMGTAADYEFLLRILAVNRIRALYLPTLIAVMRSGGLSSSSLQARLRANKMDRRAWTVNGLVPRPWTRLLKPIRKSTQYFFKKTYSKPWLDEEFLGNNVAQDEAEPEISGVLPSSENNSEYPVASDSGGMPPFYVVTVNYHNENQITRMIESLRSVSFLRKLIIVDHSGTDSLSFINSNFPILIIREPNRGYGAGMNRGLRQIPDENGFVMLCNPDTEILDPAQLVDALDYMIRNPSVGCVIPKLVNRQGRPDVSARKFCKLNSLLWVRNPWIVKRSPEFLQDHYYLGEQGPGPYEIDWGSGSAMLVRNSLFPHPISFDERFFLYFEDVDLCAQMWWHGFSVVHHPEVVLYHQAARLSRKSMYYFAVHLTSLLKFIYKYQGLFNRHRSIVN